LRPYIVIEKIGLSVFDSKKELELDQLKATDHESSHKPFPKSCQGQGQSSNNLLEINSNSGYNAVFLNPQTDSVFLFPLDAYCCSILQVHHINLFSTQKPIKTHTHTRAIDGLWSLTKCLPNGTT